MQPKNSKQPTSRSYPQPDKSSHTLLSYFFKIHFNMILPPTHTHTHTHLIDPTFVHRWANMKHVRKQRLLNTTSSKNILNKSIYTVSWKDNKVNTGPNITDRRYECRSLKNSQYKRTIGTNHEIKKLLKINKSLSFDKNSSTE